VSGVERGVRNPTITIINLLAQALKVHPAETSSRQQDKRTAAEIWMMVGEIPSDRKVPGEG